MSGNAWLLTWTTYGTWLPGDDRGFVGHVRESRASDLRADDATRRVSGGNASDLRADDATRRVSGGASDLRADDATRRVSGGNASDLRAEDATRRVSGDACDLRAEDATRRVSGDACDLRADDASRQVSGDASDLRADDATRRVIHNIPGTPSNPAMPALRHYALEQMRGPPVWLTSEQAKVFLNEARRTADFRSWHLLAVAVMANHVHMVVVVPENLAGEQLLKEFKSYGSRVMNQRFTKPISGTWWTKSGSTRLLPNDEAVCAAVEYVHDQHEPLIVWIANAGDADGGRLDPPI